MKSSKNFISDDRLVKDLTRFGYDVPRPRRSFSPRDHEYLSRLHRQQLPLQAIRELWGVQKPDRQRLPSWLDEPRYEGLLASVIFDHYGGIGDVLVAEPYLNKHQPNLIQYAIELADKYDLDLRFSLESWRFPGKTIRFEFRQQ